MATHGKSRRSPAPDFAPTTLTEITRRYYACAVVLAKAMGLPLRETFLREHRESISCCFIEAGRAGVRLPPAVPLPPLAAPSAPSQDLAAGAPVADAPIARAEAAHNNGDAGPLPPGALPKKSKNSLRKIFSLC